MSFPCHIINNSLIAFHFWSIFSSGFFEQNNCHFSGRLLPCCISVLCSSGWWLRKHSAHTAAFLAPPALCPPLLTHFCSTCFKNHLVCFVFPRWNSATPDLSQPPLPEGPLWSFMLLSMMEGFPYPGHPRSKLSLDLTDSEEVCPEERGSYMAFLFPFLTAAVAFQATELSFLLSRRFHRLSLGVALCSRGHVMRILERKEEQQSPG